MKRILIIASGALLCGALYALGTDYQVAVVDDVSSLDRIKAEMPIPVAVDYAPLNNADLLAPAFSSNFNRLVRFPELGSSGLCEGYATVARGPPESQCSLVSLNTQHHIEKTPSIHGVFYLMSNES